MKRHLYILSLLAFIACEDPISLEIPAGETKLVVEGVISNNFSDHPIKLSNTNGFSDDSPTSGNSGAIVTITSSRGQVIPYSESINEPGTYLAETPFSGTVGDRYKLMFTLNDGESFESDFQDLNAVPEVNTLLFERDEFSNDEIYRVTVRTVDGVGNGDFYRWKIFKNNIELGTLADIYLRSDRLFNGNRFDVTFDLFEFQSGDSCRVEQFSLSESAFDFFRLIQIQAGGLGESTSTAPTQVIGNIRNINDPEQEILGFFYCTSITESDTLIIE